MESLRRVEVRPKVDATVILIKLKVINSLIKKFRKSTGRESPIRSLHSQAIYVHSSRSFRVSIRTHHSMNRRGFLKHSACSTQSLSDAMGLPVLGCRRRVMLTIDFLTIPDPDGWHPGLRLKGDWLIVEISDGVLSGYGEASHSKEDIKCRERMVRLFKKHIRDFQLSLENLKALEEELLATFPDFVTATAWSGINQAFYDLLAKREQVPVWQLFRNKPGLEKLALYTTINRSLRARDCQDYLQVVGEANARGFQSFKCAPFEKVISRDTAFNDSQAGLRTLEILRSEFPTLGIRVDFHERFSPEDFFQLISELEAVKPDWIEEPFNMGDAYLELKGRTSIRLAAGELFWGREVFRKIMERQWVHIIMPDVKHVGGFGPLLAVLEMANGRIEISPHNPSGPVSTAASLHAAALYPDCVHSLEYAFDRPGSRKQYGEVVERGMLYLTDKHGWGIDVEIGVESRGY